MTDVNVVLTEQGKALRAKIEEARMDGNEIPLTYTRIQSAAGTSPNPVELYELVDPRREFSVLESFSEDGETVITCHLTNLGDPENDIEPLAEGYPLSQIGFFALDPDEGEILYRISQYDYPIPIPSAASRPWMYEPTFTIKTDNASVVVVNANLPGLVTRKEFEEAMKSKADLTDGKVSPDQLPGHDHRTMSNLEFASSGHTGFASETEVNRRAANTQASITAGSGTDRTTAAQTNPTVWGMIQNIWNRLFAINTAVTAAQNAATAAQNTANAKPSAGSLSRVNFPYENGFSNTVSCLSYYTKDPFNEVSLVLNGTRNTSCPPNQWHTVGVLANECRASGVILGYAICESTPGNLDGVSSHGRYRILPSGEIQVSFGSSGSDVVRSFSFNMSFSV